MSPIRKFLSSRIVGVALLLFALVTTLSSAATSYNQRIETEKTVAANKCQTAFNAKVLETLKERAYTRSEDADNLRNLVKALYLSKDRPEELGAMNSFIAESLQIKDERAALPIPAMEARRCE